MQQRRLFLFHKKQHCSAHAYGSGGGQEGKAVALNEREVEVGTSLSEMPKREAFT
jgi:hypothetical protein